jgi:hypothetical protein
MSRARGTWDANVLVEFVDEKVGDFVKSGKLELGSRGAVKKLGGLGLNFCPALSGDQARDQPTPCQTFNWLNSCKYSIY